MRLVVQDERPFFDRDAQFIEQIGLVFAAVEVLVIEDIGRVAQLGAVHRHVRAPEKARSVRCVGGHEGNANARTDTGVDLVQNKGLFNLVEDPLGHDHGFIGVGVHQHHCQLVAAEAHHGSGGTDRPCQARAQLTQQLVTGRVTKRVVDLLEVVEVDEEKRHLARFGQSRLSGKEQIENMEELAAIAETGELVGVGLTVPLFGEYSKTARRNGQAHTHGEQGGDRQPQRHAADLVERAGDQNEETAGGGQSRQEESGCLLRT